MLFSGPSNTRAVVVSVLAITLALIHLFAGRFRFGDRIPRSRWLSIAGGVSVSYVFVHLLPEVREAAVTIEHGGPAVFTEQYVYLIALLGFVVFYGLEQLARRTTTDTERSDEYAETGLFWIHIGLFAIYNGIIGYLLWERELSELILFFIAMALHFIVTDDGLRHHYGRMYHHRGRWVLVAAILGGFYTKYVFQNLEILIAAFVPFLAGGIILNVIKEELPSDRESRFWAFSLGAGGYAALLLFV